MLAPRSEVFASKLLVTEGARAGLLATGLMALGVSYGQTCLCPPQAVAGAYWRCMEALGREALDAKAVLADKASGAVECPHTH